MSAFAVIALFTSKTLPKLIPIGFLPYSLESAWNSLCKNSVEVRIYPHSANEFAPPADELVSCEVLWVNMG